MQVHRRIAVTATATAMTVIEIAPVELRRARASPFSTNRAGIEVRRLGPGWGYAFDYENPNGVHVLGGEALSDFQPTDLHSSDEAGSAMQHGLNFWVHLINGCNLSCHYCYVPDISASVDDRAISAHSMPVENVQSLLANIFGYCHDEGISRVGLKIAGGEPLLNVPLVQHFCQKAEDSRGETKINFSIITNGTKLSASALSMLKRYNFAISISVDGLGSSHNAIRFERANGHRTGTWDRVWASVLEARDFGLRPYLLYTVTPKNVEDLPEFAALCARERLGFRLSLTRIARLPKDADIVRITQVLVALYRSLGLTHPTDMPIERLARFAEWNLQKRKTVSCSSGRSYFALGHDGNVSTCQMSLGQSFGDATAKPMGAVIAKIASDSELADIQRNGRTGACSTCQFKNVCAGGCPQHTVSALGTFQAPSPWCDVYGTLLPVYVESVAVQMARRFLAGVQLWSA